MKPSISESDERERESVCLREREKREERERESVCVCLRERRERDRMLRAEGETSNKPTSALKHGGSRQRLRVLS